MLNFVLRTVPSRRTIRFSVIGMVCGVITTGPTGGRTRVLSGASGPAAVEAVTGPGGGTSPAGFVISGGLTAALSSSGFGGGVTTTVVGGGVAVSAAFGSGSLLTGFATVGTGVTTAGAGCTGAGAGFEGGS